MYISQTYTNTAMNSHSFQKSCRVLQKFGQSSVSNWIFFSICHQGRAVQKENPVLTNGKREICVTSIIFRDSYRNYTGFERLVFGHH